MRLRDWSATLTTACAYARAPMTGVSSCSAALLVQFYSFVPDAVRVMSSLMDGGAALLDDERRADARASEEPQRSDTDDMNSPSNLLQQIEDLRRSQKRLKEERLRVTKEVRNALKRKKRLRTKASQLTDLDLVEVLRMRKQAASSTNASASTGASTGASASSEGLSSSQ